MEDEAALLERLRAGEEAAFALLFDRYDASLRRVARSFVRTPAAAEEVVAETWLAVIAGLDRFEARSSLRTWIFGILLNKARTRAVRDARTVPFSALAGHEDHERPTVDPADFDRGGRWRSAPSRLARDPLQELLADELRQRLLAAVDELPVRQRTVITLRDLIGFSPREVSDLLGISDGNQRVLLHRARSRVRETLATTADEVAR